MIAHVSLLSGKLTHNAQVLYISRPFHLLGELVVGELPVDDLLVARAYKPTLLVQKDSSRTAAGGNMSQQTSLCVTTV